MNAVIRASIRRLAAGNGTEEKKNKGVFLHMKDPIGRPPETKYGSVFFTLTRLASLDRRALLLSGISEHEEKHDKRKKSFGS
jgi:hypothetical protein